MTKSAPQTRRSQMQIANQPPDGLERIVDEIGLLSEVARTAGSLLSLKELAELTRTQLSEEELEFWWEKTPSLATVYELKDGLILERGATGFTGDPSRVEAERAKSARAEKYTKLAGIFSGLSRDQGTRVLAISGSTSYKNASVSDDLDFFCVTRSSHLWIFMTKSLILARFIRASRRSFPRICFSYATAEDFAEKEFLQSRDALFARDALNAIVVRGEIYYEDLLRKCSWMLDYFPRLYHARTSNDHTGVEKTLPRASPGRKFLNTFLWVLVGNYIVLKSGIHNRKLRKQHKLSSLFVAKVGVDHCIFESVRYSRLRSIYQQLKPIQSQSQGTVTPETRE